MGSYLPASICLFTFVANLFGAPVAEPQFNEYPVKQHYHGKIAVPKFTSPATFPPTYQPTAKDPMPDADPRARESVEFDAKSGPNFAGRYTIAGWSCGTGCVSLVVVDAQTGKLYRDCPFGTVDMYGHNEGPSLDFHVDSKLLIATGCFDVDFRASQGKPVICGRRYYKWEGSRFVLLHRVDFGRKGMIAK